mgnify:CR=1 FL=1
MAKTGIIFGTDTGKTRKVAKQIYKMLGVYILVFLKKQELEVFYHPNQDMLLFLLLV